MLCLLYTYRETAGTQELVNIPEERSCSGGACVALVDLGRFMSACAVLRVCRSQACTLAVQCTPPSFSENDRT